MRDAACNNIPVIDLFAGPGGLGEGFSAFEVNDRRRFEILLSIEKDASAHQTLELRNFYRQFEKTKVPEAYYQLLRGAINRPQLFGGFSKEAIAATADAWHFELSASTALEANSRISLKLKGADRWVLIGGPPCQAYSLAGRSRNSGNQSYVAKEDPRQTLYVEYLQVIADHSPAIFVMENVKGLLSATVQNQRIFDRIISDLEEPHIAIAREGRTAKKYRGIHNYRLYSLCKCRNGDLFEVPSLSDFLVRTELFGIPQARHRVIILGVRDDIKIRPNTLSEIAPISAYKVIEGLPRLRSGLSRQADGPIAWKQVIRDSMTRRWLHSAENKGGSALKQFIAKISSNISAPIADRGSEFIPCNVDVGYEPSWFLDNRIGGVCNHSSRGHMYSDIHRYLYAVCFAKVIGRSPQLVDFPKDLHPNHANIGMALENGGYFDDRFRVQLRDRPSTTITSHIAKDGHYYIHYDPEQCRSLTVREAARLQTFPDNYLFCGNRTAQYTQVGNAVPPLLAREIARIVAELLD